LSVCRAAAEDSLVDDGSVKLPDLSVGGGTSFSVDVVLLVGSESEVDCGLCVIVK
jgi:hypothetical protein